MAMGLSDGSGMIIHSLKHNTTTMIENPFDKVGDIGLF
jgi:hypothetical protein